MALPLGAGPFGLVYTIASTTLIGLLMLVVLVVPTFQRSLGPSLLGAVVAGVLAAIPLSLYAAKGLKGR